MYLSEHEPVLTLKEFFDTVGLSDSCVRMAVRRVTENNLSDIPDFGIVKKGGKTKTPPKCPRLSKFT